MARNGFSVAGLRVLPKCVFSALPPQYATMPAEMPEQSLDLHPTTTSSCLASGGSARKDSSRLLSRIRAIASRRFARHSSRVLPCPLAPGTSAQYPTYHEPSCSTIAVNSLRISLFYRRDFGTGSGNAAVLSAANPDTPFTRRRTEQTLFDHSTLSEQNQPLTYSTLPRHRTLFPTSGPLSPNLATIFCQGGVVFLITRREQFGPTTFLWDVLAPDVARAVRPGHFIMARLDEHGERIPLTVADFNASQGTVTVVIQAVGKTTIEMATLRQGDFILDFIGPLGLPSHIRELDGTVVLVGGGLGVAPTFPQLRVYKNAVNLTISIVGVRNRDLMFWEDRFRQFSDELIVTTDDGSYGRKGFVSHALADVLGGRNDVREVVAIGPLPMMKACCEVTRLSEIPTIVSLNSIMVDGTGMCGSCRVTVDGKMKFACVDGADFDGHLVNFDELALRQKRFEHEEKAALVRYQSESAALASLKMPAESGGLPPVSTCELPQPAAAPPKPLVPKNLRSIPPERAPMPQQPPEVRRHNFEEVALGLDLDAALHESERCLRCKKPRCVPGCPVGIDIPGFIAALQRKDIQRSYQILKSTNALPAVCGRVCPQESQCEATCVVGAKYQPVAIGRLERFVADCAMGRGWEEFPAIDAAAQKRAAIIGSGPAGLAWAGERAGNGVKVTIVEALHVAGGVLKYGIPEFRLPDVIIDAEIENLKKMGVEIRLDTVIGKLFTIPQLLG